MAHENKVEYCPGCGSKDIEFKSCILDDIKFDCRACGRRYVSQQIRMSFEDAERFRYENPLAFGD